MDARHDGVLLVMCVGVCVCAQVLMSAGFNIEWVYGPNGNSGR